MIDAAMALFWERGYEQTALPGLEARTGLSRSSLYNTFASKHALFGHALARYVEVQGKRVLHALEHGSGGLADLHRFVDGLAGALVVADDPWGCLVINSLAEFGGRDADVVRIGQAYMARYRAAFAGALRRAEALAETTPGAVDARADLLVGLVLGINLMSRSGVDRSVSGALVDAIHREHSWSKVVKVESRERPR